MPDNASTDDLKTLWRNQMTEQPQISLERFRHKARKLRKKARREVYRLSAMAVIVVSFALVAMLRTQGTVQHIGLGIVAVWGLLLPLLAHRFLRPATKESEATLASSIDFYRKQLERHRDYRRQVWIWGVAPLFLGAAVFFSPILLENPKLAPNILPFTILLTLWAAAFFYLSRRNLRKLRRKLDILDELQKEIP